ncbi:MAG: hypothetical protein MZW92_75260 [Comamonadaceae bacterium]|nr:hypothetical protein [Comamonadaceae bacterium]
MPAALCAYFAHAPLDLDALPVQHPAAAKEAPTEGLTDVLPILLARTGHDFRWYRPAMLRRRLRRRMGLSGVDRVAEYVALLEQSQAEVEALKGEFLIGVTDFFRDPEAWQALSAEVLPQLLADCHATGRPLRVWTPGCATGEESYSIAMLLLEQFDDRDTPERVQVFGTDIDEKSLGVARRGSYPQSIAATVSANRLARFFDRRGDRYVVRKPLRDAVLFAPQSLVRDTPFSRLDLVLCRNVLIYFQPQLQERVMRIFHFALKPGGFLLLGKAESIGAQTSLFEPASRGARLFRRIGGRSHLPRELIADGHGADGAPGAAGRGTGRSSTSADIVRLQLGERRVTAAALVDRDGRVLHVHGEMGPFMGPQGEVTLELSSLIRPELRAALRARAATGGRGERAGASSREHVHAGRTAARARRVRAAGAWGWPWPHADPPDGDAVEGRPPGVGAGARRRCGAAFATGDRRRPARSVSGARGCRAQLRRPAPGQRGVAGVERGAPVVQRGAGELEGGTAGAQRGTGDRQRPARGQDRGSGPRTRRPRQPARQHPYRDRAARRGPAHPALHAGGGRTVQPAERRRRPAAQRHFQPHRRPRLRHRPARGADVAATGRGRGPHELGRLVPAPHPALPVRRVGRPRRRGHLRRHHPGAGGGAADPPSGVGPGGLERRRHHLRPGRTASSRGTAARSGHTATTGHEAVALGLFGLIPASGHAAARELLSRLRTERRRQARWMPNASPRAAPRSRCRSPWRRCATSWAPSTRCCRPNAI